MTTYLTLSLRKARPAAAALLGAFVLSLLIAPWAGREQGFGRAQSLDGALLFWALFGVPLAALILGGSAGAEARASAELEAPLPLSRARRAFAAQLAALLLVAGLAAVLVLTAAALRADLRAAGPVVGLSARVVPGMEQWLEFYLWVVAALAAFAAALSFGVALATGSGAAGGLAAGAVAAVAHVLLFACLVFYETFPGRGSFAGLALAACGTPLAAAGLVTLLAARQGRLRAGPWRLGARIAGLIVLILAVVVALTRGWTERFVGRLAPSHQFWGRVTVDRRGHVDRRDPGGGQVLSSLRGRVVWEADGGARTTLLAQAQGPSMSVLKEPYRDLGRVFVLKDGSWWLVRETESSTELWTAPALGPLTLAAKLPRFPYVTYVADGPEGPELVGGGRGPLRAPLDLKRPLRWRRL